MIIAEHLFFDYPGKRALNDISFKLEANTITALVGPNGAGKTTLLRCLAALQESSSGRILIEQDNVQYNVEDEPRKIHGLCSYLSDSFGVYEDLTVRQNLRYIAWSKGCPEKLVEEKIEIASKRLKLENYLETKAFKLSRGLRQRLAIAQSIVEPPKILLLDEPASGLDPQARYELSQLLLNLQQEGMTILVSSHILTELEDYCTHMLVIRNGKLLGNVALSGTGLNQNKNMQSLYLELMQKDEQNDTQS